MNTRSLTITLGPDWRSALRKAGRAATATTYQGETLNFETPGAFFGHLTERRWAIVQGGWGQVFHCTAPVFFPCFAAYACGRRRAIAMS